MNIRTITVLLLSFSACLTARTSLLGTNYLSGIENNFGIEGAAYRANSNPTLLMRGTPANLAAIDSTAYSFSFGLDMTRIMDDQGHTNFMHGMPTFFGIGLSLSDLGNIGLGYNQKSFSTYHYLSDEILLDVNPDGSDTDDPDSLFGKKDFDMYSDLTAWQIAYSKEITPFFRPGIAYERRYFNRQRTQMTSLRDFDLGTIDTLQWTHPANALNLGLSGTVSRLSYAVSGTYIFENDVERRRNILRLENVSGTISGGQIHDSSSTTETYRMKLPSEGGMGLGYALQDNLTAYMDYAMVFWEDFWTNARELSRDYSNTYSLAGGVEYTPALNKLNPNYLEIITYSAGLSYRTLPVDGDDEFSLNMGFNFPLGESGNLSVALESGIRRSDTYDYDENFATLWLSTGGGK
ncbi:MAG: hypothetical protein ACQEQ4_07950 [Fibrobacterota bacterium]